MAENDNSNEQPSARQKATGAPGTLVLTGEDGKKIELRFAQLSDDDISELDQWVQAKHISTAMKAAEGMNAKDAREVKEIAMQQASTLSWMHGQGARIAATLDGWVRIVLQCTQRYHPDLTHESLRKLLLRPANLESCVATFERTNVGGKKGDERKRASHQKKQRRKQRKGQRKRRGR